MHVPCNLTDETYLTYISGLPFAAVPFALTRFIASLMLPDPDLFGRCACGFDGSRITREIGFE